MSHLINSTLDLVCCVPQRVAPSFGMTAPQIERIVAERFLDRWPEYTVGCRPIGEIVCSWQFAPALDPNSDSPDQITLYRTGSWEFGVHVFYRQRKDARDGAWIHIPLAESRDQFQQHDFTGDVAESEDLKFFHSYLRGILSDPAAWEPVVPVTTGGCLG